MIKFSLEIVQDPNTHFVLVTLNSKFPNTKATSDRDTSNSKVVMLKVMGNFFHLKSFTEIFNIRFVRRKEYNPILGQK
jgi:hypothetical protein